jgi:hypothetical protein
MTLEQEEYLERAIAQGKKVVWMGNEPHVVCRIAARSDEEGMKCGYIDGGKPGDYIALWNVDPREIVVGEYLKNLT